MNKINFNDSNTLKRFKESFESVLNEKIENALISETVKSIEKMPFGTIKNIFEGITDRLSESRKGKNLIGKYVRTIKENNDLRTLYSVYDIIEKPSYLENSNIFLSEAVAIAKDINKKNVEEAKKSVVNIVKECITLSNITNDELNSLINKNKELNESINYLISTNKNASNIFDYVNKMEYVNGYINENAPKEGKEVVEKSVKELIGDLNESLIGLSESEARAMRDLILVDLSKCDKKQLFEQYKENCINSMNNIIESTDNVEEKSRLSTMREKLMGKEYSEETLKEDIINLSKLNDKLL